METNYERFVEAMKMRVTEELTDEEKAKADELAFEDACKAQLASIPKTSEDKSDNATNHE